MAKPKTSAIKSTSRPFSKRPLDLLFLFYFVIHVPITLLIDIQPLSPPTLHPPAIKALMNTYLNISGDFLMATSPTWFLSILWCELLIQFPFFFYAIHGIWTDSPHMRVASVAYAGHVLTTMVPILVSFAASGELQTERQRMTFGYAAWRKGAAERKMKGA
ncbi:Transmembrane protein 97 [Dinochytrium kinnereticum]|nr:Transmembrane protein 97 [Dinochytrium kinnereticum]